MCGIVGVAGNIFPGQKTILKQLLVADSIRGPHSTGVATVRGRGDVRTAKTIGSPYMLFNTPEFEEVFEKGSVDVVIGHNRWATMGKIIPENAHPFTVGDITGVHNGTLRGQHLLPDHKNFEVDSHNIFHAINEMGIDEAHKILHGAFALVWFDKKTNAVHMCRNAERTLFTALSDDNRTLYWASEAGMLEWILARNQEKHQKIQLVTPGFLYTYELPGMRLGKFQGIDKVRLRALTPYEAPAYNYGGYYNRQREEFIRPVDKKGNPLKLAGGTDRGNVFSGPVDQKPPAQSYKNKVCLFKSGMLQMDERKNIFYSGFLEENDKMEARIYVPDKTQPIIDELDNSEFFSARVKEVKYTNVGPYFLIDKRTIKIRDDLSFKFEDENNTGEYDDDPVCNVIPLDLPISPTDENYEIFRGFGNALLDESEFKAATKNGCIWCLKPNDVKDEDHNTHMFISPSSYVCADCQQEKELKTYLLPKVNIH